LGIAGVALTFVPVRYVAWINASFGLIALLACFVVLVVGGASLPEHVVPSQRSISTDVNGLVKGFGVICVMFAGAPALPGVYENCEEKKDFRKAFGVGLTLAGAFYAIVGGVGFYLYGPHSAELFTLNVGRDLDGTPLPGMGWLRPVVCVGISVKLLVTYPFVLGPVSAVFFRCVKEDSAACQTVSKTALGTLLTVIAIIFREKLTSLADLIGVFFTMLTCVIVPLACFLAVQGKDASTLKIVVVIHILFAGVIMAVVGTIYSATDLMAGSTGEQSESELRGGVLSLLAMALR
jgi:vesicular inhibitory amino acid transporter